MPKKRTKRRIPLTISIHSAGVDIDATITDASGINTILTSLVEQITARSSTAPPSQAPTEPTEHDFDIVKRVIKLADVRILEAIAELASHEIAARHSAS